MWNMLSHTPGSCHPCSLSLYFLGCHLISSPFHKACARNSEFSYSVVLWNKIEKISEDPFITLTHVQFHSSVSYIDILACCCAEMSGMLCDPYLLKNIKHFTYLQNNTSNSTSWESENGNFPYTLINCRAIVLCSELWILCPIVIYSQDLIMESTVVPSLISVWASLPLKNRHGAGVTACAQYLTPKHGVMMWWTS